MAGGQIVRAIPEGRVTSYGAQGMLRRRASIAGLRADRHPCALQGTSPSSPATRRTRAWSVRVCRAPPTTCCHRASTLNQLLPPRIDAALKHLQDETVPWQRVLASTGQISSRGDGGPGAQRQREALEAEGVEVTGGIGELGRVKLSEWGWFPESFVPEEGE
jgi:alkylated DNA nucleotide flippase Atl1